VIHRADLAELLYRACKRFASIDVLFGIRAYDVVSHARGVSVTVDEADGKARSARAFAFIGADGVQSRTRADVLMGPKADYTGRVAWRTTLGQSDLAGIVAQDRTSLLWGPGFHAVTYPLPHRRQMNIALFMKAHAADVLGGTPPRAPKLPRALSGHRRFDDIVRAAGNDWAYWPLFTVDTEKWSDGSIGLIGDAAHAMVPFQAQGAAMAIEDAAVLAPLLMTDVDAETALRRYQSIRQPRVERVKQLSRSNGFAFHLEWPFSLARDTVVKLQGGRGHLERLAWLYGYDPAPDPAGIPAAPQREERDTT
jgi:salicylate hydroxylase